MALTTPARIREVLEMSLGAGVDHAFIMLGHLPLEKRDPKVDVLCEAYRGMTPEQREDLDIEKFCRDNEVEPWEFLGWVVMAIGSLGGNASMLLVNSAKFPLIMASLQHAMNDPEERKQWLQAFGQFAVPQKANIINVNATANAQSAAAASAVERGLPSFVETLEETDEVLRQLPASTAEPIDVPFTITEKEPIHAGSN